ncbi:MAG: amidohydrolase family protein [Acidobacteriota bacterium]|nr:amidohydrolase family protein [Acidobacteriota bacterium]
MESKRIEMKAGATWIAFIAMICGCLSAFGQSNAKLEGREVAQSNAKEGQQASSTPVVPFADYHKHLKSPIIARGERKPFLPAVEVPEELARLLRERTLRFDNPKTIAELYTENAMLHDSREPGWFQGRQGVANFVVTRFRATYQITPVSCGIDGSRGYIAGYYTRNGNHIMHAHLSLEKGANGVWRIAAETMTFPGPREGGDPVTGEVVVKELDAAGIKKGVVLSIAYQLGYSDNKPLDEEYKNVRAENDWVAEQAALYPERLTAFCSFNPLKSYALEELERCAKSARFKGVKLHFGNSRVDIRKPEHAERLRQIFSAANKHKLAIVAHLWRIGDYETKGNEDAKVFLDKLLPEAPDIVVQIAHMAGGGRATEAALAVFAEAVAAKDPRTKNLYFDVTTLVSADSPRSILQRDVARMRQIGLDRILWGSDMTSSENPADKQWLFFRALMPLTDNELRQIANNIAPYLR